MYRMRTVLIGRGLNGWHATSVGDNSTGSSSGGTLERYVNEAEDGVPVYDASQADVDAFMTFVFSGPMVKANLPPGGIDHFSSEDKECMAMMMGPGGLEGDFRTLAATAMQGLSSLDYVAVDVYIALLVKKVPGVKLGKVQGGKVVWEEVGQDAKV